MAHLVTRADLARVAKVARPNITKAAQRNFPNAVVGDRIDIDHPDVQKYLMRHDGAATRAAELRTKPALEPTQIRPTSAIPDPIGPPLTTAPPPPAAPRAQQPGPNERDDGSEVTAEDIARYAHWSLEALVRKFGTATRFGDWLDAWKRIADTRDKALKAEERVGRVISREFVQQHVFGYLASGQTRLLQDVAPTIARRLHSEARAGRSVEEMEKLTRQLIGAVLVQMKEEIVRAIGAPP